MPTERSSRGDPAPRTRRARRGGGVRDRAEAPGKRRCSPAPWSPTTGRAARPGRVGAPRCNEMTAPDGFPQQVDPYAIDAVTAEGLLRGAVDVGDAPPEYRAVARLFEGLREAADNPELAGRTGAVDRIGAAVLVVRRPGGSPRSRRSASRSRRRAAPSLVTCALVLTSRLAPAGALPQPAQPA